MSGSFDESLADEIARLEAAGRLRTPDDGELRAAAEAAARDRGEEFLDASSNDYLGLAGLGVSRETSVQVGAGEIAPDMRQARPGAGASRLIHGTRPEHVALERSLADWVGLPSALLFTSGYAANVGALSAVVRPGALVVSDQLNHASIIDGCRLARAAVRVVPHLDLDGVRRALEATPSATERFVVVESYFSMDGDGPDLRALRALCDEREARLVVDEAHALGVFGEDGSGRCRSARVRPDILVGTLGKAVGAQGAFVAGSERLRMLLWNRARSFVFSTAPSPLLARTALFHVERARAAGRARQRLHSDSDELRVALESRGVPVVPGSSGPIVPVLTGESARAVDVARRLSARGILVQAIRPPTVPEGTARVRLTVTAAWPDGSVGRVAGAIADALAGR